MKDYAEYAVPGDTTVFVLDATYSNGSDSRNLTLNGFYIKREEAQQQADKYNTPEPGVVYYMTDYRVRAVKAKDVPCWHTIMEQLGKK